MRTIVNGEPQEMKYLWTTARRYICYNNTLFCMCVFLNLFNIKTRLTENCILLYGFTVRALPNIILVWRACAAVFCIHFSYLLIKKTFFF